MIENVNSSETRVVIRAIAEESSSKPPKSESYSVEEPRVENSITGDIKKSAFGDAGAGGSNTKTFIAKEAVIEDHAVKESKVSEKSFSADDGAEIVSETKRLAITTDPFKESDPEGTSAITMDNDLNNPVTIETSPTEIEQPKPLTVTQPLRVRQINSQQNSKTIESKTAPYVPSLASNVDDDSKIYIYTSFTGGTFFGHNIAAATSRLQTIFRSNDIVYELVDTATNERAKKMWSRWARGKRLPGVFKGKDFVGNFEVIEEANEFNEVKQLINDFA
ncbi:hypothetical protein V1511DRAFT_506241 [Dipodascopsis uninucleata]